VAGGQQLDLIGKTSAEGLYGMWLEVLRGTISGRVVIAPYAASSIGRSTGWSTGFLARVCQPSPYSGSRSIWIGTRPFSAVTRGLDPRVHPLRIDLAKMMDARVMPAHDDRVDQIDREPL